MPVPQRTATKNTQAQAGAVRFRGAGADGWASITSFPKGCVHRLTQGPDAIVQAAVGLGVQALARAHDDPRRIDHAPQYMRTAERIVVVDLPP